MQIKFYNSLNKKKEVFQSAKEKEVNIYVCGVTVYDYCHLGHARGAINFDLLRRFLQALKFKVHFIKNYTDIDDKIIQRCNEEKISAKELTEKMIKEHDRDMQSLFVLQPDTAPKATENIYSMVEMIKELILKNNAYERKGDVFFRVSSFADYGKLSGKNIKKLQAGSRVEINQAKENPLDFVLWKKSKEKEPKWQSPWSEGRPGWHIECSCMCKKFVSEVLDIHAGGSDLIFPHHENEIAQSESLSKKKMANYWLHNGMIETDGKKMSKSLGNFFKIRDLLKQNEENIYQGYDAKVVRFFILQSHYRQNLLFSTKGLYSAYQSLNRIFSALALFEKNFFVLEKKINNTNIEPFLESLADDLNTPKALANIFNWCKDLVLAIQKKEISSHDIANKILAAMKILGFLDNEESFTSWNAKLRIPYKKENIHLLEKFCDQDLGQDFEQDKIKKAILELKQKPTQKNLDRIFDFLIAKRSIYRKEKKWESADKIRIFLSSPEIKIQIKDDTEKTSWQYS